MNQINLKLSVFVAASSIFFSVQAMGVRGGVAVVKLNQVAAQGRCMPEASGNAVERLSQNNIQAFSGATASGRSFEGTNPRGLGSTDTRQQAVARVLQTINSLGRGTFNLHRGARFVFGNTAQPSRQTADHIQLNPGNQNMRGVGDHSSHSHGGTTNTALIAHELGHYVGNKGLYGPYFRFVGGCNVSGYSRNRRNGRRNEEFAEVFAAYITNPEMLANKGPECQKALDFMRGTFGETQPSTCANRVALAPTGRRRVATASTRGRTGGGFAEFLKKLFSPASSSSRRSVARNCASVTGDPNASGRSFCNSRQTAAERREALSNTNIGSGVVR